MSESIQDPGERRKMASSVTLGQRHYIILERNWKNWVTLQTGCCHKPGPSGTVCHLQGEETRERLEFYWVKSNPVPLACKEGVWYLVNDKVPLFLSMLRQCYEMTLIVHVLWLSYSVSPETGILWDGLDLIEECQEQRASLWESGLLLTSRDWFSPIPVSFLISPILVRPLNINHDIHIYSTLKMLLIWVFFKLCSCGFVDVLT